MKHEKELLVLKNMNSDKDEILLHDYFDNLLTPDEQEKFEDYLLDNIDLAIELGKLKNLQRNLKNLSSNFSPPEIIIENIVDSLLEDGNKEENLEDEITEKNNKREEKKKAKKEAKEKRKLRPKTKYRLKILFFISLFIMFLSAFGAGYYYYNQVNETTPWQINLISTNNIPTNQNVKVTELKLNSLYTTLEDEQVQILIADKGKIEILGNSKIKVLAGTQSLNSIKYYFGNLTFIPGVNNELFAVELSKAIIKSTNSKFTISNIANSIKINILSNYVTVNFKDVEYKVPSNHEFKIINKNEMSVPLNKSSSNKFRKLISSYTSSQKSFILDKIIKTSTLKEVFTLHFLLSQVTPVYRELIIEKLQKLVPLPSSANKVKILFLEKEALNNWWEEIYTSTN